MTDARSSAARCFRRIVRLILAENLQPGSRLPTQQQLRQRFSASNKTLDAAMDHLVQCGIVTRKTNIGTLLADRTPLLKIRWTVGLLTFDAPNQGPGAFYANLLHLLASRLSQSGCASATYVRVPWPHWPFNRFQDFPGLSEDLANDRLDGLLPLTRLHPDDWASLGRQGLVACHAGPWDPAPCGVFIDMEGFEKEALAALRDSGCRRIARTDVIEGRQNPQEHPALTARFVPDSPSRVSVILPHKPGIAGGRLTADILTALPPEKRPDGIVMPDDHAASELIRILCANGRYRPAIAVLTNRQLPVTFSKPILAFELDMEELATGAVRVFQNRILGTAGSDPVERISAKRKIQT